MNQSWKRLNKEKSLFRSYYCAGCKQTKPCGEVNGEYCCSCYYESEQVKVEEYSNYQQVYQRKEQEQKEKFQQLQLLRSYSGCKQCRSLAVDAYSLYEEGKLICQPCRMKKEGSASGAISFLEQQKWFKKRWGINLTEWLDKFQCLPVNKNCADQWIKDKEHLKNCFCLEQEAKESYLLFTNSLKESKEKLKKCKCKTSEKVRVGSDYHTWCEGCEREISVASKKRVIKNRNDPEFWGLNIKEKVLCGNCLASKKEEMPPLKRAEFNRYRKVKRL